MSDLRNLDDLRMLLERRDLLCCGEIRVGEQVTQERCLLNGVILLDAPALRCPICGTEYRDVELGALLEVAVEGLPAGPIMMATLLTLLDGPWESENPNKE